MASSSLSLCFSLVSASLDSFSAKRRLSICLTVLWNVNLFPLGLGFDWKSTKAGKSVERLRQHLRNAWENERRVRTGRQSEEQSSALRQEPLEKPLLKLPPLCPRASWTVGFFESKTTISEMRRTAFCVGRDKEARFGARQREIRTGTPARFRSLGCSVPFFFRMYVLEFGFYFDWCCVVLDNSNSCVYTRVICDFVKCWYGIFVVCFWKWNVLRMTLLYIKCGWMQNRCDILDLFRNCVKTVLVVKI